MPMNSPVPRDTAPQDPAICRTLAIPVTATEKRIVLLIAILAGFLTPFDGSAVNIALPTIGAAFHMDAISLSWVATAYLLASALFLVPFGKLADIYGRKKIFLWGICVFGAASLIMTLVATEQQMITVRVIQGIGAAMIFGTAIAILTAVFPPGERGRALGIYITSVYLGLSLGPFFGGILTDLFGWRSIFYINVPIAIAAAILIVCKLRGEWAECVGEKFDLTGSLIYSAGLVALMVGFSVLPDVSGGVLVVTGIALIGAFVWFEQRQPFPVLNMQLFFKSRIFAFSNIAALINYSATYAVSFLPQPRPPVYQGVLGGICRVHPDRRPVLPDDRLPVCGKAFRQARLPGPLIHRHGTDRLRALSFRLLKRDDPALVHHRRAHHPRDRVWHFLVPEHQCDHERCRQAVLRRRLRD